MSIEEIIKKLNPHKFDAHIYIGKNYTKADLVRYLRLLNE